MKWTIRSDRSGNPLTDSHAFSFDTVAHLYDGQCPTSFDTYRRRADSLDGWFDASQRHALADALRCLADQYESPDAVYEQIEKLRDPNAVAVVTGQQAGLFTGPFYAISKALSVIGLANRMEKELGRPVVPVFWIASEDHDWAEVNHAYVLNEEDEVCRIKLPLDVGLHQMVYHLPLTAASVELTLQDVMREIPDGAYKQDMLQTLRTAWRQGDSLATWFARIFTQLLGNHGLVMLDPCDQSLRKLIAPVWQCAILNHESIAVEIEKAYQDVQSAGYTPVVQRDGLNTTLFYVEEGKRYVLERVSGTELRVRGLGTTKTLAEWATMAVENPQNFSSNVLLRPLVQDFLLPTLVYVGGPSEVAYYPLSAGVFRGHGRPLVPIIHRQRVTVFTSKIIRNIKKWGITEGDLTTPVQLVENALQRLGSAAIQSDFEKRRAVVEAGWLPFAESMAYLGPQTKDVVEAHVRRAHDLILVLERKTLRILEDYHDVQVRQLRSIERWLWTNGVPQERRLSPLNFWSVYGLSWFKELPLWDDYDNPCPVYKIDA